MGRIVLAVAPLKQARGLVSRRGPTAGSPSVKGLMQATGLAYQTCFDLVRRPWRVKRLDLATVERLAAVLACDPGDLFAHDPGGAPPPRLRQHQNPLTESAGEFLGRLRRPAAAQAQGEVAEPEIPWEWLGDDPTPAPAQRPELSRPSPAAPAVAPPRPERPFVRPRGNPDQWSFEALQEAHARGLLPLPNG